MNRPKLFALLVVAVTALEVALVLAFPDRANEAPAGLVIGCAVYLGWGFAATRKTPHLLTTPLLGWLATLIAAAVSDAVILFSGLAARRGAAPVAALFLAGFALPLGGSFVGAVAALLRRHAERRFQAQQDG
jgi:hypothetical protein